MDRHISIDRIRVDTMLWVLGGFADASEEEATQYQAALPPQLSRAIEALAALPKTPHGAAKSLGERWGRTANNITHQVWQIRRGNYRPAYRRWAAP